MVRYLVGWFGELWGKLNNGFQAKEVENEYGNNTPMSPAMETRD